MMSCLSRRTASQASPLRLRGLAISFVLAVLLPSLAFANTAPYAPSVIIAPIGVNPGCIGNTVSICGQAVWVPAGMLGTMVTLTTPSPYMHQPFTAKCLDINNVLAYEIVEEAAVTCTLQTCSATNINLCGTSVPVPGGTSVGNSITVSVPPSALSDPSSSLSFSAQCVEGNDADKTATYQLGDNPHVSCNLFPCQDSRIRLCDTSIPVPGGTPLGGILHLTMPAPFASDPFTVECLGSEGNAPLYQLIDHESVTCNQDVP